MFTEHEGDLFTTTAPFIAHGVNCKGAMAAGFAAAVVKHYSADMVESYKAACEEGSLTPGLVHTWPVDKGMPILINLASQEYPGNDARYTWLFSGLQGMHYEMWYETTFENPGTEMRVAMPRIGCGIGGLDWAVVKPILKDFADVNNIHIEVWELTERF